MYAAQQTNTAIVFVFLQNFKKRLRWLRVIENKITIGNNFSGAYLGNGDNI